MIKTLNQVYEQNLSQISGPVCPQLFDLASFLWTTAFDKAEPTTIVCVFPLFYNGKEKPILETRISCCFPCRH